MTCPRCGAENREDAQFCRECGTRLISVCPNCGAAVEPASKFCDTCGTALSPSLVSTQFASPAAYTPQHLAERILTSKVTLEGERKQVTVLFADMKGSTELLAGRDPEDARRLLDPVLERMIEAVHHYEGTVNQVMGDGVMALFGAPLALEDHAVRACFAALRMQEAVKRYAEGVRTSQGIPIYIRVGLNSGEVVVRSIGSDLHMDYTAVGETTHLAARMEQLALPGSILITPPTLQLAEGFIQVKPMGPVNLKGVGAAVDVYELVGVGAARSRLQARAASGLTKFVGRTAEMEQLHRALERAAAGHGQVVGMVGDPGVGKSRLVLEFTTSHRLQGWLVLTSRSVSYGKATPYLPVIDLLKAYCKIGDRDEPREIREKLTGKLLALERALEPTLPVFFELMHLPVDDPQWLALDPPKRRRQTLDAVKRLLLRESQVQPVLLVFEDLHWIDSETQALLDSLVDSLPTARILLLVNYRPEYRHAWSNKTWYTQLRLDPLVAESAEELLAAIVGSASDTQPLRALLIARTEGNPFFMEESVQMLVETGALAGERGAYRLVTPLPAIQVPATVQAMLAARIDRLEPDAKRLLQTAAVIGKDVPFAVLAAAAERPEAEIRRHLIQLQSAELLLEASLFPDLEFTFKHALTYEVAYGGLLQERRRDLHRRAGEALERLYPERRDELSGSLARHFLEAGDVAKGVPYALRAGEKAQALYALDEAIRFYERARAAAAGADNAALVAMCDEAMGNAQLQHGHLDEAIEAYEHALAHAATREGRAALKLKIGTAFGQFGGSRGRQLISEALVELDPDTQRAELAKANALIARYHHYAGRHAQAVEVLERAREFAESIGDVQTLETIYTFLSGANQHLGRPKISMEWAQRALDLGERHKNPYSLMVGYEFYAENLTIMSRWDESLEFCDREEQLAKQVGADNRLAWAAHNRSWALYAKGELAAAEAAIRQARALAEVTGERRLGLWCEARHSLVQTDRAQDGEAQEAARHVIAAADELGDLPMRAYCRSALGYFHVQREEYDAAGQAFEEATKILDETDNRVVRIFSIPTRAEALWGQQRYDQALALIEQGIGIARDAHAPYQESVLRRVRAMVLASRRQWDEATAEFTGALETLQALGARLEVGRSLHRRGLMHEARGDQSKAQADFRHAQSVFDAIGARRDLQKVSLV